MNQFAFALSPHLDVCHLRRGSLALLPVVSLHLHETLGDMSSTTPLNFAPCTSSLLPERVIDLRLAGPTWIPVTAYELATHALTSLSTHAVNRR